MNNHHEEPVGYVTNPIDKTLLNEISNQCAKTQTLIARNYDTPENQELIDALNRLFGLLVKLLNAKT